MKTKSIKLFTDNLKFFPHVCVFHKVCNFHTLQGALDGGLDIPHSDKRFAGFKKDGKQLDAEFHREYIFGGHIASYMRVRFYIFIFVKIYFCLFYLY